MKKCCLLILTILIVQNNCFFGQFVKVPTLVKHFVEHQQRDTSITFYDFLALHYWGHDLNDNDQDRDMQLPFKKIDHSTYQLVLPFINVTHQTVSTYSFTSKLSIFDKEILYQNPQFGDLFRPPIA
ncbi:hypothetical protein SAMN05216480_1118 [Pustulibacterium marinum]|uniref:Uncharacterized protein n=1 Tax=Pustulibacterium marinum TaxID=1224947 RepID=A0A1I7HTL4_9FLAO|nr:hypothetical protein [Pustulibacterium marinum]SFU64064.1 hypothetical protein SAMN05216480_1118 [Pustulibacterium marinum]